MAHFAFVPIPRDIKLAIAGPEFFNIGRPVDTGADDVQVGIASTRGQSAGTGGIAVAVLVGQQAAKKIKGALPIVIKKIAFGFLDFFEQIVEFIHLGTNTDGLLDLLYLESDNGLAVDSNGGKGTAGVEQAQFIKQGFSLLIIKQVAINKFMGHFEIREHFLNRLTVRTG